VLRISKKYAQSLFVFFIAISMSFLMSFVLTAINLGFPAAFLIMPPISVRGELNSTGHQRTGWHQTQNAVCSTNGLSVPKTSGNT
jgi:hypothetical protein